MPCFSLRACCSTSHILLEGSSGLSPGHDQHSSFLQQVFPGRDESIHLGFSRTSPGPSANETLFFSAWGFHPWPTADLMAGFKPTGPLGATWDLGFTPVPFAALEAAGLERAATLFVPTFPPFPTLVVPVGFANRLPGAEGGGAGRCCREVAARCLSSLTRLPQIGSRDLTDPSPGAGWAAGTSRVASPVSAAAE